MGKKIFNCVPNGLDEASVQRWIQATVGRPNWIQIAALNSIRRVLEVARLAVLEGGRSMSIFEAPVITITQFQIDWPASDEKFEAEWWRAEHDRLFARSFSNRSELVDAMLTYVEWFTRFSALRVLTHESTVQSFNGKQYLDLSPPFAEKLRTATPPEREALHRQASHPAYLCSVIDNAAALRDEEVCKKAREINRWSLQIERAGHSFPVSIFATVDPLVRDDLRGLGYFPITVAVQLPQKRIEQAGLWHIGGIAGIWSDIQRRLDDELESLGEVVARHRPPIEKDAVIEFVKSQPLVPRWDMENRSLFVGEYLIKRFSQAAENQVMVLDEFEREGWPQSVDDPLWIKEGIVPKQRLRETVKSLNDAHRIPRLITFHVHGMGTGVRYNLRD